MGRRSMKIAVAVGVGVASLTGGLASPAWAPSIHTLPAGLTREACKQGGWADWGFRNQGECVSITSQAGAK
jgi:hypothetical protein